MNKWSPNRQDFIWLKVYLDVCQVTLRVVFSYQTDKLPCLPDTIYLKTMSNKKSLAWEITEFSL